MFRQIKSALIWAYIYKYRSLLVKMVIVVILLAFIEYIYRDIVEYLRLANRIDMLPAVLIGKWTLFTAGVGYILYLFLTFHKKRPMQPAIKKDIKKLSKKDISSLAQEIIEKKLHKKG